MQKDTITYRLMKSEDFEGVVRIDEKVLGFPRRAYYEMKFEKLFGSRDYIPTSIAAVNADGTLVGFVMGELYMGEFGIFQEQCTLDTIGVDPDCRHMGIGERLMNEFVDHLKTLEVKKMFTLVGWDDEKLMHFFKKNHFAPSKVINLEREL